MKNPQAKASAPADTDEALVAAFLAGHPDFFDRHAELLSGLRLQHARGDASTVSLVERQVELLRARVRESDAKLRALVDNGRANDVLATKMHHLATRLIAARDEAARYAAIEVSLREDFGARDFVLVLTRPAVPGTTAVRFVRHVAADDAGFRAFDSLFASAKPRCGRVREGQRDFLFPSTAITVGSAALVPLALGGTAALLAIASPDVDHFNPSMSTEFLARIGDLIARALDGPPGSGG